MYRFIYKTNLGRKSSLLSEDDMKGSFLFLVIPFEKGWLELATAEKALLSTWLENDLFEFFLLFLLKF